MEHTLNISYVRRDLVDRIWIRLEEFTDPDQLESVSLQEASQVIDSLFDLEPCINENNKEGGSSAPDWIIDISPETATRRLITSFATLRYDPCKEDDGGNYESQILVFRSDQNDDYKLVINDGKELRRERRTKEINQLVRVSGNSVSLNYPVQNIVESSRPIIDKNADSVLFEDDLNEFVSVRYTTVFDLVTVQIFGENEQSQEATIIAFYKGVTDTLRINPPEESEAVGIINCKGDDNTDKDEEEQPEEQENTCYRRFQYQSVCECDADQILESQDVVRAVNCPPPGSIGFNNRTPQSAFTSGWEAIIIKNFVPCPELEDWEGADPEFYEDSCCLPPNPELELPGCEVFTERWIGGSGIVNGQDYYKNVAEREGFDSNDQVTRFVAVGPEFGNCGIIETIQEVDAKDCCDGESYIPITIVEDKSVTQIADNSSGSVFFIGGLEMINISISGDGFWLDSERTVKTASIVISPNQEQEKSIFVFTDFDSCGAATLSISDICGTTTHSIASTVGKWERDESRGLGDCISGTPSLVSTVISDTFKIESSVERMDGHITNFCSFTLTVKTCEQYPGFTDCSTESFEPYIRSTPTNWEDWCGFNVSEYGASCTHNPEGTPEFVYRIPEIDRKEFYIWVC